MSCFERPVAASAVRERNDGAKPRLTNANAPFFRKSLRETMISSLGFRLSPAGFGGQESLRAPCHSPPLKLGRPEGQCGHLWCIARLGDRRARRLRQVA